MRDFRWTSWGESAAAAVVMDRSLYVFAEAQRRKRVFLASLNFHLSLSRALFLFMTLSPCDHIFNATTSHSSLWHKTQKSVTRPC